SPLKSALLVHGAPGQVPARQRKKASMSASVATSPSQSKSALPQVGGASTPPEGSVALPLTVSDWRGEWWGWGWGAGGRVGCGWLPVPVGGGWSMGVGGWGWVVVLLSLWLRVIVRLAAQAVAPGVTVPATVRSWAEVFMTVEPWKLSVATTLEGTVSENV